MTCNNIILSQPEAGAIVNQNIPDDVSARLNFGSDEISTLQLSDSGALVITFVDGGQLNVTNFEDLIENGNLLYLEDGTLIDQSILTSSAKSPADFDNIADAAGVVTIDQPGANTTQEITLKSGQKYICNFDPANAATVEIIDGAMVLTFNDGSQVVINDYSEVMAGDLPAQLTVADGTVIEGDELLTSVTEIGEPTEEVLELAQAEEEDLAQQVANIQPAAGGDGADATADALNQIVPEAGDGASGNTGFGFNSSPTESPFDAPPAIGPLGPTALQYNAPQADPEPLLIQQVNTPVDSIPQFQSEQKILDETNLTVGNLTTSGQIIANYGNDAPGMICANGNFLANGNVDNGILTSGGQPVVVTPTTTPTTTGYVGKVGGVTIFEFTIDAEGNYTFVQSAPLDHSDPNNTNEPLNLNFQIAAKDSDGDITVGTVRIVILDDAPVVLSQVAETVDETDFIAGQISVSGAFYADIGQDVDGEYCGTNQFNATGSVDNNVLSSNGVAVTVSFDANTNTYTGFAGATTVFTTVLNPVDGTYVFTLFAPLDHADTANPNDQIELNFGAKVIDFDDDVASGFFTVKVLDDAPVISGDTESLDETDGFPTMVDGQVTYDFGEDGAGTLAINGDFTATGSVLNNTLTSNGNPITISLDAVPGTMRYVGEANGQTIFTLSLNQANGKYVFTLLGPLDHADGNDANDVITLNFGVVVTDFDGDQATTTISVDVLDDVPSIEKDTNRVDEDTLLTQPIVVTDKVDFDYGQDGPGEVCGNDDFVAMNVMGGPDVPVLSGGVPVVVTFDSNTNTYTGVAGATTIFTMVIQSDGNYTYTQTAPIDHPDANDPDDVIWLKFGVKVTDFDGDSDSNYILVDVHDSAPSLDDAQSTIDETDGISFVTGNVTHSFGADGPGEFCGTDSFVSSGSKLAGNLTSGGAAVNITYDSNTGTYTGATATKTIFTMVVNSDGTYKFDLLGTLDHADPNDPNDIINLDFGVKIQDGDGDTDEGIIRIRVKDDVPTIGDSVGDVDETNLDQGPLTYTDSVDTNFGTELGSVATNGQTSSSVPLTYCGYPVTISQTNATTYTAVANNVTIFTLTIDSQTGEYTYTQHEALDHPNTNDHNDIISINFGIAVTSVDNDSDTGTITINVADDGPVARDDINGAEEDQFITGDVLANDDLSQDGIKTGDNTVTNIRFNNVDYSVPANGSRVVNGDFGVLTMNSDGTYSYQANDFNPNGVDNFIYTLTDKDGDSDTAKLDITVTPDGDPVAVSELLEVDETNLTPGPMIFNGDLNVNFGADGVGSIVTNGDFTPSGSLENGALSSNGVPVIVSMSGSTYTGTAGGVTIFTLQISNDGTYTFQLFDNLDHADATDPNDAIKLDFGVNVSDSDGDVAEGTVSIIVRDDAPVARDDVFCVVSNGRVDDTPVVVDGVKSVDETGGFDTVNGTVTVNYGNDGPGTVMGSNSFSSSYALKSCGVPVTVSFNPGTGVYTGVAGATTVFTLQVNSNGSYTFTQLDQLDHINPNDPNDVLQLTFGVKATDADGDIGTGTIKINVFDDGPVANDDGHATVFENTTVNGNVTANDQVGADAPGAVTKITFNGTDYAVPATGQLTVNGTYGVLKIASTGVYSYTANNNADGVDIYTYTLTDKDGDTDTAFLSFCATDKPNDIPVAVNDTAKVDCSDDTVSGNILSNDSVGNDGPGFVKSIMFGGQTYNLPANGSNITINADVGTLIINRTGAYTYTTNGTASGSQTETFKYTLSDQDGDTATATLNINVVEETVDNYAIQIGAIQSRKWDRDDVKKITANFDLSIKKISSVDAYEKITKVTIDLTQPYEVGKGQAQYDSLHKSGVYLNKGTQVSPGIWEINVPDGANVNTLLSGLQLIQPKHGSWWGGVGFHYWEKAEIPVTLTVQEHENDPDCVSTTTDNAYYTFYITPLVLDLDGDGIELVNAQNGVFFDMEVNGGTLDQTGWAGSDDGFLAIDNNGDGRITDRSELFGNTEGFSDGFAKLASFDSNNDGFITNTDARFGDLLIWRDANTDGVSTDNELFTLAELGISSIAVNAATTNYEINGQLIGFESTFTINGETRTIVDAYFETISGDDLTNNNPDVDGASESNTITASVLHNDELSEDSPSTITAVVFNGQTYAIVPGGSVTVDGLYGTLVMNSDGKFTYTADDNVQTLQTEIFTYKLTDRDGDTDTAELKLLVKPGEVPEDDVPVVYDVSNIVDETGGFDMVTGKVNADYGNDGPGTITTNGNFASSVQNLKSCGYAVTVTSTAGGYVGTANGQTVFTLTVDIDGNYKFTQLAQLDHPDTTNPDDAIDLKFGVTAKDDDGDTANATITVKVKDDGPDIGSTTKAVDETNLGPNPLTATGTVPHDFGQDGKGAITPNGLFQALFQMNGAAVSLTSGGFAINVQTTANGYVGMANGQTVFTLTIDPNTGNYTYQQNDTIDHPDAHDPDDVIWLKFYVDITDKDGDKDTGTIVIDIHDDGPVAVDDGAFLAGNNNIATGNVLDNDDFGADGPGQVTTTGTFIGNFGNLVLQANGTYTYTRTNNDAGVDTFNYTIKDFDGDKSTAEIVFELDSAQDDKPIVVHATNSVDETGGFDTVSGTVSVDYGADGPGTMVGTGEFSSSTALKSCGVAVQVTYNAANGVYTGVAGGKTVFTLDTNTNGSYTFKQYQQIDHPNSSNPNDNVQLIFGVKATDQDGDTGTGSIKINVFDDGPVARNDVVEGLNFSRFTHKAVGEYIQGDLLTGKITGHYSLWAKHLKGSTTGPADTLSQDTGNRISKIEYNGKTYNIADGGSVTIKTSAASAGNKYYGDITFYSNGKWKLNEAGSKATSGEKKFTDSFKYTLVDKDGDTSTATLTFKDTVIRSPLVLDLDGDGIELVDTENGVLFDLDNDGDLEQTGWVAADDGLLVLDKNNDGIINDQSELFGDNEAVSDGFANLAQYDSNQDAKITSEDDVWSDLLVWQDVDQDGISDASELLTLDQIGIVSINLNAELPEGLYIEGNWISHVSTFTTTDGKTHSIVDAWFNYSEVEDGGVEYGVDGEADVFLFQSIANEAAEINGFNVAEGDVVDLSLLIEGESDVNEAIQDFVHITESNGDTVISVDVDGAQGPKEAVEVAKLKDVTGTSLDDLIDNGNIIV